MYHQYSMFHLLLSSISQMPFVLNQQYSLNTCNLIVLGGSVVHTKSTGLNPYRAQYQFFKVHSTSTDFSYYSIEISVLLVSSFKPLCCNDNLTEIIGSAIECRGTHYKTLEKGSLTVLVGCFGFDYMYTE